MARKRRGGGIVSLEDSEGEGKTLAIVLGAECTLSRADLPKPNPPERNSQQETTKHAIHDQLGVLQEVVQLVAEIQKALEVSVEAIANQTSALEDGTWG